MATHDYVIANGTGAAVRSDLNNALAAIVSNNSGSSEPSTKYAYQWWADTTTGQLKLRNSANNAWVTIFELDGTMLMEDGTASAPGLAFSSDLNTGFFRSAADTLAIATAGAQRVTVDSSGKVGIGTTSPAGSLHVDAASSVDGPVFDSGGTGNTNHALLIRDSGNNQLFRVNNNGNVGIGMSNPTQKLSLENGTFVITGTSTFNSGVEIGRVGSDNNLGFATGGTERMRLDTSGRLLVGTSTSTQIGGREGSLQVSAINSSMTLLQTQTNNTGAYFSFGTKGTGTGGAVVQNGPLGRIQFCGFDGTDYQSVGAEIRSEVNGTPGANDMPGRLMFLTTADGASSPSERMRVDNSGRLFLFNITGNAAAGSTLKYSAGDQEVRYDTSSRLLKTDITELPYGIETVKNLKPSRYTPQEYDREGNLVVSTETAIGFIADEMVAEVPEVVMMYQKSTLTRNENDTEVVPAAINYDRLTAVLTKALQEAIAKIETLETKVAALEAG
jgi:hypothetical protein